MLNKLSAKSLNLWMIAIVVVALVGVGCGGSGGTSTTSSGSAISSPPLLTGILIDSPVSGIDYRTATQSGKTSSKGEYFYFAGEEVSFSIGKVQFPPVAAHATITPLDIAKTTDVNNQMVSNILVLLQSLDDDGNPDNGIAIPAGAAAKASAPFSFDQSHAAFASNTLVIDLVANSGSVTKTLVSEEKAKAHFQCAMTGSCGVPVINVAPVANAGGPQSVLTGSLVTLDGSSSSDANNDTLTYAWTLTSKPAGSAAALSTPTSAKPSFTADVAGGYTASLIVNDVKLSSLQATVTVTASNANAAPVANAGVSQSVLAGGLVTLDGSASSDANGDALTYAWTLTSKPAGSAAALSSSTTVKPTLIADAAGSYVVTLVVNDGKLSSASSSVNITAAVANVAPVAKAGATQSVLVGSLVTLDGSTSSDANGDALSYAWTLTAKPAGSAAVLSSSTSARPTLIADAAGNYVATLVVNDGKLSSAAATTTITATALVVTLGATAISDNGLDITVRVNQASSGYYVVSAAGTTAADANTVRRSGSRVNLSANLTETVRATGLLPSTAYRVDLAIDGSTVVYSTPISTGRNPLTWPFASNSIWNMPIGSGAVYVPANLPAFPGERFIAAGDLNWAPITLDIDHIVLTPTAPLTPIYRNTAAWGHGPKPANGPAPLLDRCFNSTDNLTTTDLLATVPMPAAWLLPSNGGNNGVVFLLPDGHSFLQTQPVARCISGQAATALLTFPSVDVGNDNDLYTGGRTGGHGGSGLSTMGGTLRLGELRPGQPAPRHVLKMDVDSREVFRPCPVRANCFRWPAVGSDSGAENPNDPSRYGALSLPNASAAMRMGALLAIPANVDLGTMGFETEVGSKLAWTLQNYGAYVVDSTGGAAYYFAAESGPNGAFADQFKSDWGMGILGIDGFTQRVWRTTPYLRDLQKIIVALNVVDNNGPSSIGGGGTPRQPLAVPLRSR